VDDEQWLTVQQIAERLQMHEQTIRKWLRTGELSGVLLGDKGGWRVRPADLEVFLRGRGWAPQGEQGKAAA
jgi:excisionase family DNA binding protein